MVLRIRSWGLVALACAMLSLPCRAQNNATAASFDGTGATSLTVPTLKFEASAKSSAKNKPSVDSHDLYYFSPQEAAKAAKIFANRPPRPKTASYTFDSDVPADIQAQMRADLTFIGTIQGNGATPLHQQIFGMVDGPTYAKWFENRVTAIGMDDCGDDKAVACVIPMEDPSKMWITQNYIKFSHPQIARLMVVFHEARHTETRNGNWPHAYCPDPFLDANGKEIKSIWTGMSLGGEPACDITPFGSYGSSTILLKNIQKYCTNCTDKVKMDAGLYADDQLQRVTDPQAHLDMVADFKK